MRLSGLKGAVVEIMEHLLFSFSRGRIWREPRVIDVQQLKSQVLDLLRNFGANLEFTFLCGLAVFLEISKISMRYDCNLMRRHVRVYVTTNLGRIWRLRCGFDSCAIEKLPS